MARITINGVSVSFSIKAEVRLCDWDTEARRGRGRTQRATELNLYMDNVRAKINVHYRDLSVRTDNVTAIMIRDAFHWKVVG